VISYAPMASGLLTGGMTRERAASLPADDFRSRNPEFREPKLSKNIELVEQLKEWCKARTGGQEKLRLRGCCGIRRLPRDCRRTKREAGGRRYGRSGSQAVARRDSEIEGARCRGRAVKAIGENMDLGLKGKLAVVSAQLPGSGSLSRKC